MLKRVSGSNKLLDVSVPRLAILGSRAVGPGAHRKRKDGFRGCLLEKETATHSSTLAWKIPWTEEPGRLQSMGLQRVTE